MNPQPVPEQGICWQTHTVKPQGEQMLLLRARYAVIGVYFITQELCTGERKPRWHVLCYESHEAAKEAAVIKTRLHEDLEGHVLSGDATNTIKVHPDEYEKLARINPIPVTLRNRIVRALEPPIGTPRP